MTPMQFLLIIAVCLVLFLVFLWFLACFSLFRYAFARRERQGRNLMVFDESTEVGRTVLAGIAYADSTPHEDVFITAHDGIRLAGHLYGNGNARGTVILFHGYRSFGEHDFGCVLSTYTETHGFRVLVVDQRAHGASEGKYITFGILERRDCLAWAEYVASRYPDSPIVLDGLSMGSTTVMMASALPLPSAVCGIIADCGFTSPEAILRKVAGDMHIPVSLFFGGVCFFCRLVAHFNPREITAPEALAKNRLPVLMIHGLADDYVPCEMSRENAEAGGDRVQLVLVENAGHGMSYLTDTATVKKALADFFARIV